MSLSIREAVPEDYEELSRLITDAYREFAQTLGDDWEGYRDELADVARRAARGSQFVAETEGRPVGTVTYYPPREDEEWFKLITKTDVLHVPFTGSAPALPALLGNHVDLMFDTLPSVLPLVQEGKLRALGVDPATRGRGVGRALTIACIERARADGAAGIALNTLSFMPAATALYEGLGFRETGDNVVEWGGGKLLSYIQNIDQIS